MAKESEVTVTNNFLDNAVLKGEPFVATNKLTYTRKASGVNTINTGKGEVTIDFEGLTAQVLQFVNKGGSQITYKLSGATANTGTLEAGGILTVHGGNIVDLKIASASVSDVEYEYLILG